MADTTRYMRVEFPTDYEKTERVVVYGANNTEIVVNSDLLVTADEIPREGEGYTVEEYRETLKAIYDLNSEEREKVFGSFPFISDFVKSFSASELIEKYRAYVNTPKVGEYWKRKGDGEMVVVRRVEEYMALVYYCDGSANMLTFTYLLDNFIRTEHKSKYLESFLSEMKEVSK